MNINKKIKKVKPSPLADSFYEQYCAYEEWIETGCMPTYFIKKSKWGLFKKWIKKKYDNYE